MCLSSRVSGRYGWHVPGWELDCAAGSVLLLGNEGNRSEAQSPWAASVWADYHFTKRLFYNYYLRSMSLASIQLPVGLVLLFGGAIYGGVHWLASPRAISHCIRPISIRAHSTPPAT